MVKYIVSPSGKHVGVIERDNFALDPREFDDCSPEEARMYDNGDVWWTGIYEAPAPGAEYNSPWSFIDAMLGDPIDMQGSQYGYENALTQLKSELSRRG